MVFDVSAKLLFDFFSFHEIENQSKSKANLNSHHFLQAAQDAALMRKLQEIESTLASRLPGNETEAK